MNDQRSAILKFLSYEFPKLGKKIGNKYESDVKRVEGYIYRRTFIVRS